MSYVIKDNAGKYYAMYDDKYFFNSTTFVHGQENAIRFPDKRAAGKVARDFVEGRVVRLVKKDRAPRPKGYVVQHAWSECFYHGGECGIWEERPSAKVFDTLEDALDTVWGDDYYEGSWKGLLNFIAVTK